jgi:uncharacterized protein YceK
MKATALVITAAVGLALSGCGSGAKQTAPKRGSQVITFTAPTTTTIADPTTGQAIRCTYHGIAAGAYVPSAGHGVAGNADGQRASATLDLTRDSAGTLTVSCVP